MKARKIVDEMDSYVPGRSQDEIAEEFGLNKDEIIKLGSNENPWGPSPKAMEAIRNEIKSINRYPESQLKELVHEMALYSGVEDNQVIIGGDGADEIIDVLAKTFIDEGDEFIVPLPSYMYYEYLLQQYGAHPVYAKWDLDKNELDVESIFDCITQKTKMIFLCSPNNPTGTLIPTEVLRQIASKNPEILIVVDEAYFEYSEITNKDLINEFDNKTEDFEFTQEFIDRYLYKLNRQNYKKNYILKNQRKEKTLRPPSSCQEGIFLYFNFIVISKDWMMNHLCRL